MNDGVAWIQYGANEGGWQDGEKLRAESGRWQIQPGVIRYRVISQARWRISGRMSWLIASRTAFVEPGTLTTAQPR